MSEAASVPFSETKAPEAPDRLNRGALGLIDISASTMANIGPAYSFYFSAGFPLPHRGNSRAADDHRGRHRDRAARQHAVAVLPCAPVHRRVHLLRRQDIRRHERCDHRAAMRGRLHHRYLVSARHLRRLPVAAAAVLLQRGHPMGHLLGGLHRRSDRHDGPRRSRVHQAGRAVLRLRDAGACRGVCRRARQERRSPVRGAVRAQPPRRRLQRAVGRVPAGRLPVHRLGELCGAGRGDQ